MKLSLVCLKATMSKWGGGTGLNNKAGIVLCRLVVRLQAAKCMATTGLATKSRTD